MTYDVFRSGYFAQEDCQLGTDLNQEDMHLSVILLLCALPLQVLALPFWTKDGWRHLPLKSLHVQGEFFDSIGEVTVRQVWTNNHANPVTSKYKFTLDSSAVVNCFKMKIGNRAWVGVVKAKDNVTAKAKFSNAVASGIKSSILEKISATEYQLEIGPIPPSETAEIEFHYRTPATVQPDGSYRFFLPTNIAPKYTNPFSTTNQVDKEYAAKMASTPYASQPPYTFDVDLTWRTGSALRGIVSATNEIHTELLSATAVRVRCTTAPENGDFSLLVYPFNVPAPVSAAVPSVLSSAQPSSASEEVPTVLPVVTPTTPEPSMWPHVTPAIWTPSMQGQAVPAIWTPSMQGKAVPAVWETPEPSMLPKWAPAAFPLVKPSPLPVPSVYPAVPPAGLPVPSVSPIMAPSAVPSVYFPPSSPPAAPSVMPSVIDQQQCCSAPTAKPSGSAGPSLNVWTVPSADLLAEVALGGATLDDSLIERAEVNTDPEFPEAPVRVTGRVLAALQQPDGPLRYTPRAFLWLRFVNSEQLGMAAGAVGLTSELFFNAAMLLKFEATRAGEEGEAERLLLRQYVTAHVSAEVLVLMQSTAPFGY